MSRDPQTVKSLAGRLGDLQTCMRRAGSYLVLYDCGPGQVYLRESESLGRFRSSAKSIDGCQINLDSNSPTLQALESVRIGHGAGRSQTCSVIMSFLRWRQRLVKDWPDY